MSSLFQEEEILPSVSTTIPVSFRSLIESGLFVVANTSRADQNRPEGNETDELYDYIVNMIENEPDVQDNSSEGRETPAANEDFDGLMVIGR